MPKLERRNERPEILSHIFIRHYPLYSCFGTLILEIWHSHFGTWKQPVLKCHSSSSEREKIPSPRAAKIFETPPSFIFVLLFFAFNTDLNTTFKENNKFGFLFVLTSVLRLVCVCVCVWVCECVCVCEREKCRTICTILPSFFFLDYARGFWDSHYFWSVPLIVTRRIDTSVVNWKNCEIIYFFI